MIYGVILIVILIAIWIGVYKIIWSNKQDM